MPLVLVSLATASFILMIGEVPLGGVGRLIAGEHPVLFRRVVGALFAVAALGCLMIIIRPLV